MPEDLRDCTSHRRLASPCCSQEEHVQVLLILKAELCSALVHRNLPAQGSQHVLHALHPYDPLELLLHVLLKVRRALTPRVRVLCLPVVPDLSRGPQGIRVHPPVSSLTLVPPVVVRLPAPLPPPDRGRLASFLLPVVVQRHPDASAGVPVGLLAYLDLVEVLPHVVVGFIPPRLGLDLLRLQLLKRQHDLRALWLQLCIHRLPSFPNLQGSSSSLLSLLDRVVMRVPPLIVPRLQASPGRQEDANDLQMPPDRCEVQRALPRRVLLVHSGLVLQQQLHQLHIPRERCKVQWGRLAHLCLPVGIRSAYLEQSSDALKAALETCHMQQRQTGTIKGCNHIADLASKLPQSTR